MKETDDEEQPLHRRTDPRDIEAAQAGLRAKELCRKYGISDATFYKWRSKYGGMEVATLAPKIVHHAAKGEYPGWDITSYDAEGREIYIEVAHGISLTAQLVRESCGTLRVADKRQR